MLKVEVTNAAFIAQLYQLCHAFSMLPLCETATDK
jgi:hypothetical protein